MGEVGVGGDLVRILSQAAGWWGERSSVCEDLAQIFRRLIYGAAHRGRVSDWVGTPAAASLPPVL